MPRGYSGKFSGRQYKIQLSKDNFGEQNVLESAFFCLSEKPKIQTFNLGGNHGFVSRIYWIHYEPSVLSYSVLGRITILR